MLLYQLLQCAWFLTVLFCNRMMDVCRNVPDLVSERVFAKFVTLTAVCAGSDMTCCTKIVYERTCRHKPIFAVFVVRLMA